MRIAIIMLALLAANVLAIGVSPSTLRADSMSRGQSFETSLALSGIQQGTKITLDVSGEAGGWITWNPEDLDFSGSSQVIPVLVSVPEDAANGNYSAMLVFRESVSDGSETQNKLSVKTGVSVQAHIEVTGRQVRDYYVSSIRLLDTEYGTDSTILLKIVNTGNVEAAPDSLIIDVYDMALRKQQASISVPVIGAIQPHSSGSLVLSAELGLDVGDYQALIKVIDNVDNMPERRTVFRIVPVGTLSKKGDLTALDVPDSIKLGDTCRIGAQFENTGDLPVSAVLVSELYQGNRLLQVVKSDVNEIYPGETGQLAAYYVPLEAGKLSVVGHVVYENKKTQERSGTLTVAKKSSSRIILIIAATTVLALVIVVYRRRK